MYIRVSFFLGIIALAFGVLKVVFGIDLGEYSWLWDVIGSGLLRLFFLLILIASLLGIYDLGRNLIAPREGERRKPLGGCGILALVVLTYFMFVGVFLDY